jgi:membrane protein
VAAYEDGCLGTAKGAAYSAILAFFPVLTTLAALLVQAKAAEVSRIIAGLLFRVVPPGTEELVQTNFTGRGTQPGLLLVAAVALAAWAASGVMMSLMEGFQSIYKIPTSRGLIQQRAMALFLVFTSAVPVVGASALILFGGVAEREISQWLGFLPEGEDLQGWLVMAGEAARFVTATGTIVFVTGLLYYFGPNRRQTFRKVWAGAAVATALWLLATYGFAWYVQNIANYNVLYGSIGAGIALLVWMWLVAVIAQIGCEFNALLERTTVMG